VAEDSTFLQKYEMRAFRKVLEPEKDKGSEQLGYLAGKFVIFTRHQVWLQTGEWGRGQPENLVTDLRVSVKNFTVFRTELYINNFFFFNFWHSYLTYSYIFFVQLSFSFEAQTGLIPGLPIPRADSLIWYYCDSGT
jgi:hypothetical protein